MIQRLVTLVRRAPPDADVVLLTILCLPAVWPLFSPGYPATHDGLFHLYRLVELDRLWKAGELYPRLAPDLALGYDYPVFNYYAPLALFAGELLRTLGLSATSAVKAVFGLSIVGAAWSMRLFLNDRLNGRRSRAGALVGALAYCYLPYLLLDVYVRGALAEALAMAVLPLVLWATGHLAQQPGIKTVAIAGLSLAGLVLTHSVAALLALPLLGGYWLLVVATERRDQEGQRIVAAAAALALGLALSAFYWVPALGELGFILTERATTGFFDFHQHFQTLGHLLEPFFVYDYHTDLSLLFRIGLVQLGLIVAGMIATLTGPPDHRREGIFWDGVVLVALALTWTRSAFVWEHVPLLAYAQFPWRWLAIVGLGTSALVSYLASGISAPGQQAGGGRPEAKIRRIHWPVAWPRPLGLIWAGCLGAIVIVSAVADVRPDRLDLRAVEVRPATEQQLERAVNSIAGSPGEYLPRWANPAIGVEPTSGAPAGDVRFAVRAAGPFAVDLDVSADRPMAVTLDRFYFPGWEAEIDGRSTVPRASGPQGLLAVDVPRGEHRLQIWFGATTLRWAAEGVSLAALLALVALGGLGAARATRENPRAKEAAAPPGFPRTGSLGVGAGAYLALVLGVVGLGLVGGTFQPRAASASLPGIADFESGLRLAGSTVTGTDAGRLALTLYWQALRPQDQDYQVELRLVDMAGRVVGERTKPPDFGLRPTRFWQVGQLIRDDQEISLQPGMPAGQYQVLVALLGAGPNGTPSPVLASPGGRTTVALGTVWVPGSTLPAASGATSLATFADQVAIAGVQLRSLDAAGREQPPEAPDQSDLVVRPGDRLRVAVQWRDLRDLEDNYTVFVHLVDRQGRLLSQQDEWPRQRFYPTILWLPGEIVPDSHDLRVPADAPLGRYDVELGLYRLADLKRLPITSGPAPADQLRLGSVTVRPPTTVSLASITHRLPGPVDLGNEVRLLGFDLSPVGATPSPTGQPTFRAGDHVAIVLYWQASRRPRQDYTVFLHLLDASGKLVAQTDGQPRSGDYPTSAWGAGDTVADPHRLDLPGDLRPGTYRLEAGMYLLQTGARLALPSGGDQIVLQDLAVVPGG